MYLHKPEEAFRISLFLIAAQFHLFIITLTGQVIADQSSKLSNNMYVQKYILIILKNYQLINIFINIYINFYIVLIFILILQ